MMTPDGRAPIDLAHVPLSSQWKNPAPSSCVARPSDSFRNRELSIGVSVKLTSIDTRIEKPSSSRTG